MIRIDFHSLASFASVGSECREVGDHAIGDQAPWLRAHGVDRRIEEDLWKEGKTFEGIAPEKHKLLRLAALDELIDLHLLRLKPLLQQPTKTL